MFWVGALLASVLFGGRKVRYAVAIIVAMYAIHYGYRHQHVSFEGLELKPCVVVTGASSGIGYETSFYLARQGLVVVATVRSQHDQQRLQHVASSLSLSSDVFRVVLMDVANASSVQDAFISCSRNPLLGVVNNAGVGGGGVPLELDQDTNVDRVMNVNWMGALRVMREAAKKMRTSSTSSTSTLPHGRVVSVSSTKGGVAVPGDSSYCASKAALEMATRVLSREMKHLHVQGVIVRPGYIATRIGDNARRDHVLQHVKQHAWHEAKRDHVYGGFLRRVAKETSQQLQQQEQQGISPERVASVIHCALVCRQPDDVLEVGGPEVVLAQALNTLIPSFAMEDVADLIFDYGNDGSDQQQQQQQQDEPVWMKPIRWARSFTRA